MALQFLGCNEGRAVALTAFDDFQHKKCQFDERISDDPDDADDPSVREYHALIVELTDKFNSHPAYFQLAYDPNPHFGSLVRPVTEEQFENASLHFMRIQTLVMCVLGLFDL